MPSWFLHCALPLESAALQQGKVMGQDLKLWLRLALLTGLWLAMYVKRPGRPEAFHFFLLHHMELYMRASTGKLDPGQQRASEGPLKACFSDLSLGFWRTFGKLWRPRSILISQKHHCHPCNLHSAVPRSSSVKYRAA